MSKNKVSKFIYWAPRILSVIFILFLALMSLDIFEGNYGFWGTILGLFMHNIPTLILIALLIISWKKEIVGAITFFIASALYIIFVLKAMAQTGFEYYYIAWILQISGVSLLIGILFLINWKKRK